MWLFVIGMIFSHPGSERSDLLFLRLGGKFVSVLVLLCSGAGLARRTSGLCSCPWPFPRQQETSSAGMTCVLVIHRKSFEFEDASSLQSLYPSSPTENGTESQPKFGSKSTLEENAYEDIVGKQWPEWWQGDLWGLL